MGYNQKALLYCGTHTTTFLKRNCSGCGQGMCTACMEKHPHFCPECVIELKLTDSSHQIRKEVLVMLFSGLFGLLLVAVAAWMIPEFGFDHENIVLYLVLGFVGGLSMPGTYFFTSDETLFGKRNFAPFPGFKANIYAFIFLVGTGVSAVYFVYQLVSLFFGLFRKKRL